MGRSPWIAAAATAVLVACGTASAHAAPSRWEVTSGTSTFSFEICGLDFTAVSTFTERLKWKQPRDAGAPRLQVMAYQWHVEFTADGVTLTTEGQGLFKDRRANHVEGTVWEYVVSDLGMPYTLRDPSGRVLVRDRGVITWSFRVDTLGDVDPDNDVFVDMGPVLGETGAHPRSTSTSARSSHRTSTRDPLLPLDARNLRIDPCRWTSPWLGDSPGRRFHRTPSCRPGRRDPRSAQTDGWWHRVMPRSGTPALPCEQCRAYGPHMGHDARRAFRSRVAAVLSSEALVWAVVLGCLSALAAASGALSD